MAKRPRNNAEMNLDSLLDTLTNVVGVLVMVLMLTTLNVQQAVQRILDIDPSQLNVSPADLTKADKEAAQLRALRTELEAKVTQTSGPGPTENFGVLVQQISALKAQQPKQIIPEAKVDDAKTKVEAEKKKGDELSKQLVTVESELARLKALLDETEVVAAPPAKIVNLPNPRNPPTGAKEYRVIVRDGQIVPFNPTDIKSRCKKQVEALLRSPTLKKKSGEVDCEKLVAEFNKNSRVYDSNFKVQLAVVNFSVQIVFELRPTGGETPQQVVNKSSKFQRGLLALKQQHGDSFYLRFLVWDDSFDAYVAARSVCDEMDVMAGWEPYTVSYTWREGLGLTVPCEGRPPPPKPNPNPPPKPTGPPAPAAPNDVVD